VVDWKDVETSIHGVFQVIHSGIDSIQQPHAELLSTTDVMFYVSVSFNFGF
jgi:hypothetical protein